MENPDEISANVPSGPDFFPDENWNFWKFVWLESGDFSSGFLTYIPGGEGVLGELVELKNCGKMLKI